MPERICFECGLRHSEDGCDFCTKCIDSWEKLPRDQCYRCLVGVACKHHDDEDDTPLVDGEPCQCDEEECAKHHETETRLCCCIDCRD